MGATSKPEFPPLLGHGFHDMTVAEVRQLCVGRFPTSITRSLIMDRLHDLIRRLSAAGVTGKVWVDGSFVTEKIDPGDVDILIHVTSDLYDNDPVKRATVDWAAHPDRFDTHSCDAYKWIEYSVGHPLFADSEDSRRYWTDWYGLSRGGTPKGIVVISLPAVVT